MANIIPLPQQTFNPMGTGQVSNPLAGSIDALFEAYKQAQATKLQNAQIPGIQAVTQGQVLANTGTAFNQAAQANDYAATHYGYSPQQIAQGFQVAQGSPSLYGPPQPGNSVPLPQQQAAAPGAPMQPGQPMPLGPQVAQPQAAGPFGHASPEEAAQNLMRFAQAGQQIGAANAMAGLQNTQATIGKTQAETEKLNAENAMLSGGSGMVGDLTKQILSGKMAPGGLSDLGRGDLANSIKLGVNAKLAAGGAPVQALQNAADKSHATATYEGGPDVQGKVRTAQSISADANVLGDLSKNLGKNDWQIINKYGLAIAAQRGNVPAQEILDQAKLVADRFQALVGGGSDAKLELGLNLFDAAKTPAQLTRSVARVNESLGNYASSLQGKGTTKSTIPDANAPAKQKADNFGITPEARSIIESGLKAGIPRDQIKAQLRAKGY